MMKLAMKPMLKSPGFALPTILIASVVMLIVLLSAITAVNGITGGLNSQYYNQLAREAAESGLAYAEKCLRASSYTPTWTDAVPLKPDVDCNGAALGGGFSKYVISTANLRTTYVVKRPTTGTASSLYIVSTGTVELVRTSAPDSPWRTFSATTAKVSRYNDLPQIAGGAGWKNTGHNGYMLTQNGILYGWGDNNYGQLGDASLGTVVATPLSIAMPSGVTRAKKVYNSGQGASILCIIATEATLGDQAYCRGQGGIGGSTWQRFGLTAGLTAVDMVINGYGGDSACVLASDAQAYCAGEDTFGMLGNGNTSGVTVPLSAPTKFRLDLANPGPLSGSAASLTVKKLFNQDRMTCVIASDDQAYCAGDNNYGQLGQSSFTTNAGIGKSIPGRALIPGNLPVDDIRLSYHGALEGIFFKTSDPVTPVVYMSGFNMEGTANDGANSGACANGGPFKCYPTPHAITDPGYSDFISIGEQGADRHALCVLAQNPDPAVDSGLWCIGRNAYGQLGLGDCADRNAFTVPSSVGGQQVKSVINVAARYQMNSVMVITRNGDVYAAGDNTYGKLGTGGPLQACNSTFAKVQLPAGVKAVALANGDEYTAFILGDNGKVYAVGRNNNGQLGDGTTTDRSVPVEVKIPRQETLY